MNAALGVSPAHCAVQVAIITWALVAIVKKRHDTGTSIQTMRYVIGVAISEKVSRHELLCEK